MRFQSDFPASALLSLKRKMVRISRPNSSSGQHMLPYATLRSNMLLLRFLLCVFGLVAGLPLSLRAQETGPAKSQPVSSGMGVSTGAPRSAVFDALHRPITAGGFVEGAPGGFVHITKQTGLGKISHQTRA